LSTTHKILSNIRLSRLMPYAEEIIGDNQYGFCTRPSSDPSSSKGILGVRGWRQQGRYARSKLQKTASCTVKSLDVPTQHTHLHPICCLDTPERFTWIKVSCLSLIKHCQNSKSGQYHLTSGSKTTGWNALRHKHQLLCWPADIHSVTWSLHPPSSHHLPATRVARRRAQFRNLQSEQNERRLADVNLY